MGLTLTICIIQMSYVFDNIFDVHCIVHDIIIVRSNNLSIVLILLCVYYVRIALQDNYITMCELSLKKCPVTF